MKRFHINFSGSKFSIILLLLLAVCAFEVNAQEDLNPAKWTLTVENPAKKLVKDEKFTAVLKAQIEKGWHLYALEKIEGGPIPTRISLAENQLFELGKIIAPKPIETDDTAFGVVTKFYEDSAEFALPLKVLGDLSVTKLKIKVYYQICNDETCLPPKSVIVETDL